VAADQGQSQLRNLLNQALEPAMFVDPCTNLLREIDWDINRVRLAAYFVGQLMAMVLLASAQWQPGVPQRRSNETRLAASSGCERSSA